MLEGLTLKSLSTNSMNATEMPATAGVRGKVPAQKSEWAGPVDAPDAYRALSGFVDQCIKAGIFPNMDEVLKMKLCLDLLKPIA